MMHASAAPPMNSPPIKIWGKVTVDVSSWTDARMMLPLLSGAYSSASKLSAEYGTPMALSSLKTVQQNSHDSIATIATLPSRTKSRTMVRPSSVGSGNGCGKAVVGGTDSRRACSAASMSAGTSSNSGVDSRERTRLLQGYREHSSAAGACKDALGASEILRGLDRLLARHVTQLVVERELRRVLDHARHKVRCPALQQVWAEDGMRLGRDRAIGGVLRRHAAEE
eukprot:7315754-Prymnesium_polylepis.3